jgi:hypothetical protein
VIINRNSSDNMLPIIKHMRMLLSPLFSDDVAYVLPASENQRLKESKSASPVDSLGLIGHQLYDVKPDFIVSHSKAMLVHQVYTFVSRN